jgi:hypothetical protein
MQSDQQAKPTPKWVFPIAFLFCLGLLYVILIYPAMRMLRAREWTETPCVIQDSEVSHHSDGTYSVDISYTYRVGGQTLTSDRYSLTESSSSGFDAKQAIVDRYPAGSRTVCFVNPADPSDAVIERGFTAGLLWGLVPLMFMFFIVMGFISSVRRTRQPNARTEARSRRTSMIMLFGTFALAGMILSYPLLVSPLMHVWEAGTWIKTPCVIESSDIGRTMESHGPTYGADIRYSYMFGAKGFTSSRYQFWDATSNGFGRIANIVNQHQAGDSSFCYVNPTNPSEAVLNRGLAVEMLIGLVPIICMFFGVTGLVATLRGGRWGSITVS